MMNDQLKEFVERKREEFDQLEAPVFNLESFKAKQNQTPEKRKSTILFLTSHKWLVAASVIVVFGSLFFFLIRNEKSYPTSEMAKKVEKKLNEELKQEPHVKESKMTVSKNVQASYASFKGSRETKIKQKLTTKDNLYLNLADSTSSSNRLSAIIEIEKTGTMSNAVLDQLSETLNKDENSNVRLAALSLLAKYSYDAYVSSLLVRSLNIQNDPMVQLELVNILGKIANININDKLYALANDPNTFSAVKDEAYNILLREDKL